MPNERQLRSAVDIKKIVIRKPSSGDAQSGQSLDIVPAPADGKIAIFANLNLVESIYQTGISGLLKIKDPGLVGDNFNLVGNEQVDIEFQSPDIEDSYHNLTLCVSNVRFLGDEASTEALVGDKGRAGAGWELDLTTCESYFLDNHTLSYMDNDWIGKISDFVSQNVATKYLNPGAISNFSHSKNSMDIEETHNSIWLKKHHNMYPWGKDVHPPNLLSLMNNLCENSCSGEGGKRVNFLFWQDFDGWHFKSIAKIIDDSDTTWGFGMFGGDNARTYYVTDQNVPVDEWSHGDPRIESFKIISEYDHLASLQNGAYSSYYELVKPNYDDPYFDYLDFTTGHMKSGASEWGERQIITYDYHRDSDLWGEAEDGGRIEQHKLLPSSFDTSINAGDPNNIDKKSRRKYDDSGLYGYFSSPYNHYEYADYDYMGSVKTKGKYGKQNDKVWQTMFDISNLDHLTLKKIEKDIKDPIREKYEEYVQVRNLKEKWNVYKKSICCDKEDMQKFTFFAVIDDAVKVQDNGRAGIYEYTWREVEMWPKDSIEENAGEVITPEDAPITVVVVEGGLEGTASLDGWGDNPAYNINELMNVDIEDDVFAGPGVNLADEDHNDYPEAFQMMPVGGYFKIGDDPCEEQEEGETGVYFHRHIVQMYKIPNYVLETIVPIEQEPGEEPDPEIPTEIYLFDVPNAHDGLCSCP
tara:strand:- start:109 stop:2190 length:2082 start_codon:yes stop_codon:yes gene_type:complete